MTRRGQARRGLVRRPAPGGSPRRLAAALLLAGLVAVEARAESPAGSGAPPVPAGLTYDLALAVETALQRHPALAGAAARADAARTGVDVAGAQYRPYIEGKASVQKTLAGDRAVVIADEVAVRTLTTDPFYTGSLGLVVPLIREGRLVFTTLPSERVAAAGYESARQAQQLARTEVVGHVTVAFLRALSAREELRASERVVELRGALVDTTRLRFEQGLLPRAELMAAESALAAARADRAVAQNAALRALADFVTALGLDPAAVPVDDLRLVDGTEPGPPPGPLPALIEEALARHPAILGQDGNVRQAVAAREVLQSARYPTLEATTTLGAVDDFSAPVDFWSLRALIRLNWKIFDFGALRLRLRQQDQIIEAERRALEETRHRVAQSVIAAYRTLSGAESRRQAAEQAVELADEQARAARERFQQNLIPHADLLQAEVNLDLARKLLVQAEYAVRIDQALLRMAMGVE